MLILIINYHLFKVSRFNLLMIVIEVLALNVKAIALRCCAHLIIYEGERFD